MGSDWKGPSWLQPHHPSLDRTDLALSMGQAHPELPFGVWMKGEGAKPFPRALAGVQRLGGGSRGGRSGPCPSGMSCISNGHRSCGADGISSSREEQSGL